MSPASAQYRPPSSEEGRPYFSQRYPSRDYRLHYQNWNVVQGNQRVVYFANTGGVLAFDGASWQVITLPEGADPAVRSLATDEEGRLFVGGVAEVGYLTPDSLDRLHYVSLLEHLPPEQRRFGDTWTTLATSEGIFFQSFAQVARWDGEAFHVWTTPSRYHKAFVVEDTYYVREEGVGLLRAEGDRFIPVPGGEAFADVSVFGLVPHPRGLLVVTRSEGLVLLTDAGLERFPTEVASYLDEYRPYDALRLERRVRDRWVYALATFGGGVVLVDDAGRIVQVYREEAGLSVDDLVLGLCEDHQGGLWMALDNGIARIDVLSPLTRFDLEQNLEGVVYNVTRHRGVLYAATTTGVYRLVPGGTDGVARGGRFEPVPEIRGQTWDLLSTETGLLVTTNEGVVEWTDGARRIITIGQAFQLHRSTTFPGRIYAGMKDGVAILTRSARGWEAQRHVGGLEDEIRSMEEDAEGGLWARSASTGVLRLAFSGAHDAEPAITRYEAVDGQALGSVVLERIGDRLVLLSPFRSYGVTFGGDGRAVLQRDPALEAAVSGETGFVAKLPNDMLVVERARSVHLYHIADGLLTDVTPPVLHSGDYRVTSAQSDADGVLWIGTEEGLLRYDPRMEKNYAAPYTTLIRSVRDRHRDLLVGEARSMEPGGAAPVVLTHRENALRFTFAAPSFNAPERTEYQFRLDGFDEDWSAWSREDYTEYTNLPERGAYRFRVRARNAQGVVSEEAVFTFEVLPPWYRAWWAFIVYVVAFGVTVWGISAWRLRRHRRELEDERMVNQRLERMNARLADTNERLRQADKLKDDLLANTSHELRTPLTAILGFSSVLTEEGDEEQRELATAIHRSGQRLLDTVNSLLDMAKLQANMMELRPVEMDVADVAADVLAMLRPLAEERGLYLKLLPEGHVTQAVTDRYGLERILINLVSNAIKFTEQGGITVLLDADAQDVVLTVRDTGVGMEASFLPQLFDAFTQASSGYARSHEGSGLGLAIVKRVVDLLGGRITVASEPGEGTTFTVVLPRLAAPPANGQRPPWLSATPRSSEPVLQGARLLVIEPDPEVRAVLDEAMGAYGTLVVVDTLSEALREARAMPYDVVLVGEPLDDPDEERRAVQAIHSLPGYARTPVALLADDREDAERPVRLGYDHVLGKPVAPEALRRLVESLLTRAEGVLVEE